MNNDRKQNVDTVRWYKRPAWLASLAALIAACSFAAFVTTTIFTSVQADKNSTDIETLERAIQGIENNQAGIEELVSFVRDVQAQDIEDSPDLDVFIDLLCSSSDPVRRAACEQLGEDPLGNGEP